MVVWYGWVVDLLLIFGYEISRDIGLGIIIGFVGYKVIKLEIRWVLILICFNDNVVVFIIFG